MENIIICIKKNERVIHERDFNDRSSASGTKLTGWLSHMNSFAESLGISLSQSQLSVMKVPNTEASLSCMAWMHEFFNAIGDKEPDRPEIHLDAQPVKQFYYEYKDAMNIASFVSNC